MRDWRGNRKGLQQETKEKLMIFFVKDQQLARHIVKGNSEGFAKELRENIFDFFYYSLIKQLKF